MEVYAGMKEGGRQVVLGGSRECEMETAKYLDLLTRSYRVARPYKSSKESFKFLQLAGRGSFLCSPLALAICLRGGSSLLRRHFICYRKKEKRLGPSFLSLTSGRTLSSLCSLSPYELKGWRKYLGISTFVKSVSSKSESLVCTGSQ